MEWGGRGVKEKNGDAPSVKETNGVAPFVKDGVTPSVTILVQNKRMRSIRAISERFANTAYVFFLGKRVAYLVVANYLRNT
ncbi:hypothetical protein Tco_1033353 [Tanacetum coccineum]